MATLIDTNVLSELISEAPEPCVTSFVRDLDDAYISVITIHELLYGIELLSEGNHRRALKKQVEKLLRTFDKYILTVDSPIIRQAAEIRAKLDVRGNRPGFFDITIGATALTYNMRLATRNVKDFKCMGVDLVNPWEND